MKKNVMMRLASFLLVAVLISTSAISGTYAKYVTSAENSDSARVAKFGVVVTATGSLFEDTYKDAPTDTEADQTVVSAVSTEDVVAPGTNNAEDAFKFSITGKPEVDVKVEVAVTEDTNDVFLKAKTGLPKMTTGNAEDTFDLASDYHPVKYTLKHKGAAVEGATDVTLAVLAQKLEAITTENVAANTDLTTTFGEYEITWKWDFNGDDDADTLLGDLAAGTTLTPAVDLTAGTDYNLNTGLKITVTVTQVN